MKGCAKRNRCKDTEWLCRDARVRRREEECVSVCSECICMCKGVSTGEDAD